LRIPENNVFSFIFHISYIIDEYSNKGNEVKTETITLFHANTLQSRYLLPYKGEANLLIQIFTSLHADLEKLQSLLDTLAAELPQAVIIGATTDGEIESGHVYTNTTVLTFTTFRETRLVSAAVTGSDSERNAAYLADALISPETRLLLSFTDGTTSNGETYLDTLNRISLSTPIAGGLAGDNATFTQTYIIHGNQIIPTGAVGVSLNSETLQVMTDYSFDWQPLGRAMTITKATGNRVYTIDHLPATEIYGKFLGREIEKALPNIGIEFPLILKRHGLIYGRAVLAKFDDGSLTFAGNLKEGESVYLGFADINQVMQSSLKKSRRFSYKNVETFFIYSCMARRRFMRDSIHTEIEPYAAVAPTAGFFTYGEFFHRNAENYLFNSTMTVVALSESSERPAKRKETIHGMDDKESSRMFRALSHLFKVTQTEYELNQKLLNTVVTTGGIGYFIRDHEHDTITFSEIAKELFGLIYMDQSTYESGYKALSTLVRHLIHPDDRKRALRILQDATQKQKDYELITRIVLPNGIQRHIKLITHLSFNGNGRLYQTIGTIYDLTELKEEQLRHEELSFLVENTINEVYIVDAGSLRYRYANTKALERRGYTLEELSGMTLYDSELDPDNVEKMAAAITHQKVIDYESSHLCRDGSHYPAQSQIYKTRYFGKDVYVIFSRDVSQEKQQELNELTLKKTLEDVLDYSGTLFLLSSGTELVHANKALLNFLGLGSVEELIERYHCMMDIFEEEKNYFSAKNPIVDCQNCNCIMKLLGKDILGVIRHAQSGQKRVMKLNVNRLPNGYYIVAMTDVTEIEEEAKRFEYQANHDELTGAYNRSYLEFIYQRDLDDFILNDVPCSFILLDIDDFKQINDNYGHLSGDNVLISLSKSVSRKIRHNDTLVRWGGEEFLLLLPDTIIENAVTIAEMLRKEISQIDTGSDLSVTASFGVTQCREGDTKERLFARLDKALYSAKKSGKNCVMTL